MTRGSSAAGPSPAGGGPAVVLTELQVCVVQYAANGHTDQRIADALDMSIHTVRDHWRAIKAQLRTVDRSHSVAVAVAAGVITVSAPTVRRAPASTTPSTGLLLLAQEARERRLTPEEGAALVAGVERLYRARRSSRDEHQVLEKAQRDAEGVADFLLTLAGQMPLQYRRALLAAERRLRPVRGGAGRKRAHVA